jgi:hypothetical protein
MDLWVMDDASLIVAESEPSADPLKVRLGLTAIVRYWGTTQGRGQLALTGPTEKTICDPEPPGGELNWLHVRRRIPVTEEARQRWLLKLRSAKKS